MGFDFKELDWGEGLKNLGLGIMQNSLNNMFGNNNNGFMQGTFPIMPQMQQREVQPATPPSNTMTQSASQNPNTASPLFTKGTFFDINGKTAPQQPQTLSNFGNFNNFGNRRNWW